MLILALLGKNQSLSEFYASLSLEFCLLKYSNQMPTENLELF